MSGLVLAIDTAGPNCAVALVRECDGSLEVLAHAEERIGRGHAEVLMPMIEAVLDEAGTTFGALQRIAVTTGPGSFTGVRVGIAAARGLALALGISSVGIGSLEALALPTARRRPRGTIVAALDARRGEIFVYAKDAATDAVLMPAAALSPDEAAARLLALRRSLILTGSGATSLASFLSDAHVDGTADVPDIADVAALGLREDARGPPVPLYLRSADAKPQSDKAISRR